MAEANEPTGAQEGAGAGEPQQGPGGEPSGHEGEKGTSTNPLYPDLKKYRDENKTLKAQLREVNQKLTALNEDAGRREQEEAAHSKEDYENLKRQLREEHAAKNRSLDLIAQGQAQGIDAAFLRSADDGKSEIEDVLTKAKELQEAFVNKLGGGAAPPTRITGGSTPAPSGKRTWKESEIAALSPKEYAEKRDEIHAAQAQGRVLLGQ